MTDDGRQARVDAGIVADTASLIGLGSRARRMVLDLQAGARSIQAGAHLSRFRGRGMDFAESREYHPGDDVRHIDWRVTARTGKPHTKLYVEERERPVFLMLDLSPGMFFGTRGAFKSVTAARAAAYTAWSVVAGGDRVGGVVAAHGGIRDVRPAAGRRGVLRLLSVVAAATEPDPAESGFGGSLLDRALGHLGSVVHPGSLVILFSDFHHCGEETRRSLSRLTRHNDVVACQVLDPLECEVPGAGSYLVSDGERKSRLDLSLGGGRSRYRQYIEGRQRRLGQLVEELRIPLVQLVNGGDLEATLMQAFGDGRVGGDG